MNNLEQDLVNAEWICDKAKESKHYAQNLYAAMCNNEFVKNEVWPILKDERWSCSWRYAGSIIANMVGEGNYMDWYCSGIGPDYLDRTDPFKGYVQESIVTDEVKQDLLTLGWTVIPYEPELAHII
jgi:hypothetical protein